MNNKLLIMSAVALLSISQMAYAVDTNKDYSANHSIDAIVNTISAQSADTKKQELSPIEKIFEEPDSEKNLKQIGYDIFDKEVFLSTSSKVSKDYKFNIGDRIAVFFWGDSVDLIAISGNDFLKSTNDLIVDMDGNVFIPGVGILQARGKTSSDITQSISKVLKTKFNQINVKVTLANPENFPVIVTGNVKYKGTIYLNNHSTILDALSFAGGVLKSGSLREIVYINGKNQSKLTLDLYDILLNGNLRNIKFNEGDIIFVKPIGKVAAVKEGVNNPGIYEFKSNETLRHLINYAGGLLPTIDQRVVQVESFDSKIGQRQLKDVPYTNLWYLKPVDGDSIVFKNMYNSAENVVFVEGNVKHPGSFQYKQGMKLSDILHNQDEMLSQTFTDQAVIERLSGIDKNKEYIPISLTDYFKGYINPELKAQDKIKIYPATTAETIEVSGYILNPGLIPYQDGLTLKKLLSCVRFGTSSSFVPVSNKDLNNFNEIKTKNIVVEIISKNPKPVNENTDQDANQNTSQKNDTANEDLNSKITSISDLRKSLEQKNLKTSPKQNTITENKQNDQQTTDTAEPQSKTQIVYLYDLIVKNDQRYDVPVNSGDKIIFRLLQPNETVESIGVFGYVNSPGVFKYQEGMNLKDTLKLANGLASNGYLKGLVLLRPAIAEDQRKNIQDSLMKLQEEISLKVNTIQTMTNNLSSESIKSFLNSQKDLLNIVKEKAQKDYGRLMIEINANNIDEINDSNNIELKPGDEIYIPYQSNHVVVMGEVLNNIAVTYNPKMSVKNYIAKVGGYTDNARKNKTYIIKANGSIERLSGFNKSNIEPGDTIVIPKRIKIPINWLEVAKSAAQIAGNILSSMYILTKI